MLIIGNFDDYFAIAKLQYKSLLTQSQQSTLHLSSSATHRPSKFFFQMHNIIGVSA